MRMTRFAAQMDATGRGFLPIEVDGIPEGFAFKKEPITIGRVAHPESYMAYIPLGDGSVVASGTTERLVEEFNHFNVYGK